MASLRKQLLRNGILAGILAVLVMTLMWVPDEPAAPEFFQLISEEPDRIAVYRIDDGKETLRFTLEREGDQWFLLEPANEQRQLADIARARALIHALAAPSRRTWSADDISPEETGLDTPRYRIVIDEQEIFVGDRGALGNQRYVSDSKRILLISDILLYHLQRDPATYLPTTPDEE
jgi:hypothetical protein